MFGPLSQLVKTTPLTPHIAPLKAERLSTDEACFICSPSPFGSQEQTTLDEDFSPGTNVIVGFNGWQPQCWEKPIQSHRRA